MKVRNFFIVLIVTAGLAACGQRSNQEIYEVVAPAALQVGDAIPAPTGDVVLTIDGNISQHNEGETLVFDMETLEKLGVVQYDVDDPFVKKNIVYSGVLLSEILKFAGAAPDAKTITLHALDDYSVDMPLEDATKWPVLVALKADGKYMPIENNGPLISIFPFNDFPDELDHLTYDAFWVWSLAGITVK
jgi:hypothetical protein